MAAKIKRNQIKEEINYNFEHWKYGIDLQKMKQELDTLEKIGAEIIDIELEDYWGDKAIKISAYYYREETDEEYKSRIKEENEKAKRLILKERELFEQLKKKFES
jgi:hypothetical protein